MFFTLMANNLLNVELVVLKKYEKRFIKQTESKPHLLTRNNRHSFPVPFPRQLSHQFQKLLALTSLPVLRAQVPFGGLKYI